MYNYWQKHFDDDDDDCHSITPRRLVQNLYEMFIHQHYFNENAIPYRHKINLRN